MTLVERIERPGQKKLLAIDGGGDRSAGQQRRPCRDLGPLADHQHFAELDRGTGLARELLHRDHIVFDDLVLLAAGPDHSEHDTRRYGFPRTGRNRRKRGGRGCPVRESRIYSPMPVLKYNENCRVAEMKSRHSRRELRFINAL